MTMSAADPAPIQCVALIPDMVDMVTLSAASLALKLFLRVQACVCAPARIGGYHVHHVRPFAKGGNIKGLQADMVRNSTISDHVHHVRMTEILYGFSVRKDHVADHAHSIEVNERKQIPIGNRWFQ